MSSSASLPPGFVIAAPRSGSGKTTLTLGLLRALTLRGMAVQPFKCGPDYIDPAFHQAAAGRPSFNIDSWGMSWPLASQVLARACRARTDIVVAEGLMGLFDGVAGSGQWGNGASADLAVRTGWPVVLVLDISGQSQSAAAVALGFRNFRPGVEIAGVVLNRCGSARHIRLAKEAVEAAGLSVVGALPRDASVTLPERHLGLVQADETAELAIRLDSLAGFVETHVEIDRLLALARVGQIDLPPARRFRPPGQRIALARDAAFSFVYPHVLEGWRMAGAEILPFSPLADEEPDGAADIVWLPGGYPELHAGRLAAASRFMTALVRFAERRPVHGECGGYMALGAALTDPSGTVHRMAGLLGVETSLQDRKMTLGYRRAKLRDDCPLGARGDRWLGHEFRYATIISSPDVPLFDVHDSNGARVDAGGGRRGLVTGSFFHVLDIAPLPG